jgi:hypothetical protein
MASAPEWQQRVQAWRASGVTPAAYGQQHELNPYTFKLTIMIGELLAPAHESR